MSKKRPLPSRMFLQAIVPLSLAACIPLIVCLLQPEAKAVDAMSSTSQTRIAVTLPVETHPTAPPDTPLSAELIEEVTTACDEYNVPLEIALGVIETESCYQSDAVNGNCVGLYQINMDYAQAYIDALGVTDIADPMQNIVCGVWYLGQLLEQYGDVDLALMHYSLGNLADELWASGIHSTTYTDKVHAAAARLT